MASMSYCRFENTAIDIRDCLADLYEALGECKSLQEFIDSRSSDYESEAVLDLFNLCEQMSLLRKEFEI